MLLRQWHVMQSANAPVLCIIFLCNTDIKLCNLTLHTFFYRAPRFAVKSRADYRIEFHKYKVSNGQKKSRKKFMKRNPTNPQSQPADACSENNIHHLHHTIGKLEFQCHRANEQSGRHNSNLNKQPHSLQHQNKLQIQNCCHHANYPK